MQLIQGEFTDPLAHQLTFTGSERTFPNRILAHRLVVSPVFTVRLFWFAVVGALVVLGAIPHAHGAEDRSSLTNFDKRVG